MLTGRSGLNAAFIAFTALAAGSSTGARASEGEEAQNNIIVTGTRGSAIQATESTSPVQVVDATALSHVGQPSINQALNQTLPSFTAQAYGGDASQLTLSARLRGLSPNHVLILINGKRRHPTANLQSSQGPFQGGAAPDLDLIPPGAIERIEVLQDGAAAQYGSDAIAGVINIILKSDRSGGQADLTAGEYYRGDGTTLAASSRLALPLGENGHIDVTLFHRSHDASQTGGADVRLADARGVANEGLPAEWLAIPGFPYLNRIAGDPRSRLTTVFYDASYDLGGPEAYSFGSYGRRTAKAAENYRLPNRISRIVNGEIIYPFRQGFTPYIGTEEEDLSFTGGLRNETAGWKWDLSGTYGRNGIDVSTLNTANASLYADTGFTPRDLYDGKFIAKQLNINLDIARTLDIGLSAPLTIAFGSEFRRDTYEIRSGDEASIYKEGGQSFPGFQPTDAGRHSRRAIAGYVDVRFNPTPQWTVDAAGRIEHYGDFGDTVTGKLSTRYELSPGIAVRGTVSTGFRAPSLAESYYSATQVSPSQAVVQLPANSASAALLGFQPLKAEKSTNLSLGLVARLASRVTVTLDAYQIRVRNRIVSTGNILGKDGATVVNPLVLQAIALHGNTIDPGASYVSTSTFANAIDTRTRGIDLTASATTPVGKARIDWTLAGNYNRTRITKDRLPAGLLSPSARGNLETVSPRYKIGLGALFTDGPLTLSLRETIHGPGSTFASPDSARYYPVRLATSAVTDVELGYRIGAGLNLAVGATNLLDKRSPAVPLGPDGGLVTGEAVWGTPLMFSPYGINGGYYYSRLSLNF